MRSLSPEETRFALSLDIYNTETTCHWDHVTFLHCTMTVVQVPLSREVVRSPWQVRSHYDRME